MFRNGVGPFEKGENTKEFRQRKGTTFRKGLGFGIRRFLREGWMDTT